MNFLDGWGLIILIVAGAILGGLYGLIVWIKTNKKSKR